MHKLIFNVLKPVLNSLIILLLGTGFAISAEFDDTSMFVDAFIAYQSKDYPLAIQKLSILNQVYPDTPLRDVALLLMARSGLKSGNNELAAHSIGHFTREFAFHPFTTGTEEELKQSSTRPLLRGEESPSNLALRTTTLSAGISQSTREHLDARRDLKQRTHSDKIQPAVLTPEKIAASTEKQRPRAALTNTQHNIKAAITVSSRELVVEIGQTGNIPFQIINPGIYEEELILEISAPSEFRPQLIIDGVTAPQPTIVTIGKGGHLSGSISFNMPLNLQDGHKTTFSLQVSSKRSGQSILDKTIPVFASAPLLRVVARPLTPKPAQGEQMQYRVTLLNLGTIPNRGMITRVFLPEQIEFLDAPGVVFDRESVNTIVYRLDTLEIGKQVEFTMNVKVGENSIIGQELRSRIEVYHVQTKLTEIFSSLAAVVRGK